MSEFATRHLFIALAFLALGMGVGLFTSVELLGWIPDSAILLPQRMRSVHLSLMLYGFVPLMLSYLPFFLIERETGPLPPKLLRRLEFYAMSWYLFLAVMVLTLLLGDRRGLPFYDFDYRLNFLLAFAGLFYLATLFGALRRYERLPLWIRVSLAVTVVAPVALLALMNPVNGPVNATLEGPHGDNTLGMSFALIPLYYLLFKTLCKSSFRARWPWLWILPLAGYLLTLLWRVAVGPLSYGEEWAAQWLTLLYLPLLWRWWRDARLPALERRMLGISLLAFLFVDLEGNLLFIPTIRWAVHRNDLVVGHAHIAMGIGVFMMALSLYGEQIRRYASPRFVTLYALSIALMALVLSLAGLAEAGWVPSGVVVWWKLRSLLGLAALASLLFWLPRRLPRSAIGRYHLLGFLGDAGGGVGLLFAGEWLYGRLGWPFDGIYVFVVFAFMAGTGWLHLLGILRPDFALQAIRVSSLIRMGVGGAFGSLALAGRLGAEGWLVAAYDLGMAYAGFWLLYSTLAREETTETKGESS